MNTMADAKYALPTIHILGGGPSGLSAAFHLTSPQDNPDWASRYKVVVHQLGWRLGGKGATGRSAKRAWRVEEHGIHLFGNMYSNSLHMLNKTLIELSDSRTMQTELLPSDFQLNTDFYDGRWHGFSGGLPHNDEDPWEHGAVADLSGLMQSMARTVKGILDSQELPIPGHVAPATGDSTSAVNFITEQLGSAAALPISQTIDMLGSIMSGAIDRGVAHLIEILEKLLSDLKSAMSEAAHASEKLRWVFVQIDLLYTSMKGALADDVFSAGIDVIDNVDYRTWLTSHGAADVTMQSSLLQAIPNTCMQYPNGDTTVLPQMAASAYLTFILRQVVAPGDAAYFFKVGTGDTVILPIYQALVKRGVTFEFFHKVKDLIPNTSGTRIESIDFEIQATTKSGGAYDPLTPMPNGDLVWPSEPNYDQLVEGNQLQPNPANNDEGINLESWWADWTGSSQSLLLGPEDQVVVALPPQAQRFSCGSALAGDAKWSTMIDEVKTTPTQALQIWLTKSLAELGWRDLDKTNRWLGPCYTNPISAFGDFSETIHHEVWPAAGKPEGLIYFCGALQDPETVPDFSDHDFPKQQRQRVRDMSAQYLRQLGGLLPGAGNGQLDANSLDFSLLACYDEATAGVGENRVDQQYYRANIDPNERYTVSAPGTLQFRLKAWESSYSNVALSSDAIYTGFNIGSFEGSVMSGMLASLAVSGSPKIDDIYGYDFLHPNAAGPKSSPLGAESTQDA